ncbi:MAG: TonB-dependent receptor [Ignavibacteria bacterium]|nr:TonB-dependent receptor [Ignavibacteria bacterium]
MTRACSLIRNIMFSLFCLAACVTHAPGQTPPSPQGGIAGSVTDAETRAPLVGANVTLPRLQRGATTDADGRFRIDGVPVGSHTARVTYIGYQPNVTTDIIVRSARVTTMEAALAPGALRGAEVVVQAAAFERESDVSVSAMSLSAEDIRREAATGGDISRIIAAFPSVAKSNDTRNDLVVRGGSPIENAFFIDNIEIPNINHYPQYGASGGALGIIHVDAIREVDFSAGGFSARYGDRLSSVMNISLREGNREEIDLQADLHFMGAGVQAEGPLPGRAGSWFLSARRSWLDFLLTTFSSEVPSSIPAYGDVHAKVVWHPSEDHTLSLLDIFAADASSNSRDDARETGENSYGQLNSTQNTAGLGWTWLRGTQGYSNTTLAHTAMRFDQWYGSVADGALLMRNASGEDALKLRSMHFWRAGERHSLEAGFDATLTRVTLDAEYGAAPGADGIPAAALRRLGTHSDWRAGAYLQYAWKPAPELSITAGLRADYASRQERSAISPRLSLRWEVSPVSTVSASAGVYLQALPSVLLYQQESNRELPFPRALHAILGYALLLDENTRALAELYAKEYTRLPVDPTQPQFFVLDELALTTDYFNGHAPLSGDGRARSYGLELSVQKKLVEDLYGTVSASFSRSTYRGADGVWRARAYDTRWSAALMGGYRLSRDWECSVRWIFSGGAPYTPFDAAASVAAHRGVPDLQRVYAARLPAYHSLNLRADRRFFFERSTLTAYLAVWNVYGRENVPFYRWNENSNRQEAPNLWSNSPLPVFGLEFEF